MSEWRFSFLYELDIDLTKSRRGFGISHQPNHNDLTNMTLSMNDIYLQKLTASAKFPSPGFEKFILAHCLPLLLDLARNIFETWEWVFRGALYMSNMKRNLDLQLHLNLTAMVWIATAIVLKYTRAQTYMWSGSMLTWIASMLYVVEDVICGERIGCVGNSYSQDWEPRLD